MLVVVRGGTVVDRPLRAVLRDEDRVVRQSDNHAFPQGRCRSVLDRLACLLVDDAEHGIERLPRRLVLRPTG